MSAAGFSECDAQEENVMSEKECSGQLGKQTNIQNHTIRRQYIKFNTMELQDIKKAHNVYDKRKSQTSECHKKSYLHNKIQDIIPKTNPKH
jgi:hypothetical protein